MLNLDDSQKFEAVKYRHEGQAKLLQFMFQSDLKIFISFLTLELVFGGFVTQVILDPVSKWGLFIVNFAISFISSMLLYNNYRRRKEVVVTIRNCNTALGYNKEGAYIENQTIDGATKFRPWFWWYIIGIFVSLVGISIILLGNPKTGIDKPKEPNVTYYYWER